MSDQAGPGASVLPGSRLDYVLQANSLCSAASWWKALSGHVMLAQVFWCSATHL
jgi:hypothetical protein